MLDFESGGLGSIPGRGKCDLDFSPFLLHLVASMGWQPWSLMGEASAGLSLGAIGMNAYKCLVIGRRDVAVRYMIHFYCLAVEAGFYSDVVECWTLNPADQVRSPIGENVIWIFLLSYCTFMGDFFFLVSLFFLCRLPASVA